MNKQTLRALLALAPICVSQAVYSQTQAGAAPEKVETIEVTGQFLGSGSKSAMKLDVPVRDTPFSVSSYSDAFMKSIETTNVADLYKYMTGVARTGGSGNDLNIRGFSMTAEDRNATLVDGLRHAPEFELFHVNPRLSRDAADIGRWRAGKLLPLLAACVHAWRLRLRHGSMTFYYVPAPGKRSALYRDWIVMLLCRPFFSRLVLHWRGWVLPHSAASPCVQSLVCSWAPWWRAPAVAGASSRCSGSGVTKRHS